MNRSQPGRGKREMLQWAEEGHVQGPRREKQAPLRKGGQGSQRGKDEGTTSMRGGREAVKESDMQSPPSLQMLVFLIKERKPVRGNSRISKLQER